MILFGITILAHSIFWTYTAVKWRKGYEEDAPMRLLSYTLASVILLLLYMISFVLVMGDLSAGQ